MEQHGNRTRAQMSVHTVCIAEDGTRSSCGCGLLGLTILHSHPKGPSAQGSSLCRITTRATAAHGNMAGDGMEVLQEGSQLAALPISPAVSP